MQELHNLVRSLGFRDVVYLLACAVMSAPIAYFGGGWLGVRIFLGVNVALSLILLVRIVWRKVATAWAESVDD